MTLIRKARRIIRAAICGQLVVSPRSVVSADRIDIAAKTLFARSYIKQINSPWPEEVYREHLRSWNGFFEETPRKENYNTFKNSFISIIESYRNNNMYHEKSPIYVDTTGRSYLLKTGGHRVAAAIVTNRRINIVTKRMGAWWSWGADFFRGKTEEKPKKTLNEKYIDAMTIEYASLFGDRLFAAIIFPAADGHRDEARRHLESIGKIVNYKKFKYNEFNPTALISQIYYGEEWNYKDSIGLSDKVGWCFDGSGDIQVYIIESKLNNDEKMKEKDYLRGIWGIGKSSIHMTDTAEEVNIIARMFFHANTRMFLKEEHYFSGKIGKLFDEYRQALPKDYTKRDEFCIEASAVLDLMGLRKAADLDYMSFTDKVISNVSRDIELHDADYINYYYDRSRDDMIFNPSCHFYYAGCKIAHIEMVLRMKQKKIRVGAQSHEKDRKDTELIKKYLEKN